MAGNGASRPLRRIPVIIFLLTHSRHSALAARTAPDAPNLPFAVPHRDQPSCVRSCRSFSRLWLAQGVPGTEGETDSFNATALSPVPEHEPAPLAVIGSKSHFAAEPVH